MPGIVVTPPARPLADAEEAIPVRHPRPRRAERKENAMFCFGKKEKKRKIEK